MKTIWRALEELPTGIGVAADWQHFVGDAWPAFQRGFLDQCSEPARSYCCPQECGCGHRVVHHGDGRIVAVCECDPWNCDDIPLTAADVVEWEFNRKRLARALSRAFELERREQDLGLPWTQQVATFGGAGLPVVLTIQPDRAGFAGVVAQLVATLKERFILLAPTGRFMDAHSQALLKGARAGFFDLESHLELLPTGRLYAARRAGDLFAAYLPEQTGGMKEAESKRVFRLFGELLALGTDLKAPPAQVFNLMVLKKLNQAETAVECGCVRSLITSRVALIEGHFQMPIEKLRDFASDIKERQTTVKADKYAKKKHGSPQVDAPEPDEDLDDGEEEEFERDE